MYNIIRYIRQNRLKILIIIIFIIFVYSIIISANQAFENAEKQKIANETKTQIKTDGTVSLSEKNCRKVIEEFLKNCAKGKYEEAYSYLSQQCKDEKYPTLEEFENNYCVANSVKGKGYSIESQKQYNYKIELNNVLSTGGADSKKITNYFSITVDNGHDIKINID